MTVGHGIMGLSFTRGWGTVPLIHQIEKGPWLVLLSQRDDSGEFFQKYYECFSQIRIREESWFIVVDCSIVSKVRLFNLLIFDGSYFSWTLTSVVVPPF